MSCYTKLPQNFSTYLSPFRVARPQSRATPIAQFIKIITFGAIVSRRELLSHSRYNGMYNSALKLISPHPIITPQTSILLVVSPHNAKGNTCRSSRTSVNFRSPARAWCTYDTDHRQPSEHTNTLANAQIDIHWTREQYSTESE